MPNYAPHLTQGHETRLQPQGIPAGKISGRKRYIRMYANVEDILLAMDKPVAYVRDAVLTKMIEDGLIANHCPIYYHGSIAVR